MNYKFDNQHRRAEDAIHADLGEIAQDLENADPWAHVDLDLEAFDAPTPEFIQQHDLTNKLGKSLNV